ncbi:MAG TPA: polysaccharide biosynthesis tyrosine autokinase [Pilimelia sp.]|nr:polysaccharide biosynthesis tyrosine autokinase [Pilimelia sp.]
MELRDYLRAARHRWWLVLAVTALAVGLAALVNVRTPAQYAASVTFFVTTPNNGATSAYQGGLFSQQRVKSYADLLTSDRLAEGVLITTDVPLTVEAIRGRISAQAIPDTVLLQVTVTDGSADRAERLATAVASQFIRLVKDLETPPGARTPAVKAEVIAGPRVDPRPVAPRPARNLAIALLLGIAAGIGAACLREALDTTVKSGESLPQLTGAPLLGVVPFDGAAKRAPLVVAGSVGSPRAEALRQVRTNLKFLDVDNPVRTMVVTSAVPGEGKSCTATNLAIVLAESGRRVLLLDADLRRPRLADYLGLEGAVGLSNVLAGQATLADVTQQWGRNLWVLPSGFVPPNPSEMLGSQHMQDLLNQLREEFDTVIVDTPPLLPVTDAAVVATRVDGAILVTRSGKTTQSQATTAANAVRAVNARLLGCVLNMVKAKSSDAYHYYDYRPHNVAPRQPADADDSGAASPPAPVEVPVTSGANHRSAGTPGVPS